MANGVDLPVALPAGDAPCPGLAARPHARAEDDRHASRGQTPRGGRSPAYREAWFWAFRYIVDIVLRGFRR